MTRTTARSRRRRRWLIALIAVASVIAIAVIAAGGFLFSVQREFYRKSTQVDLPPSTASGKGQNYLLLGSDKRDPETAKLSKVYGQRSDAMMLVHVNEDKTQVYVGSIPRDLYVDIPGHGMNKINAALAFGGVPLAVKTVENYTGAKIDHVVLVDFDGLQQIVDVLGGVDVKVDKTFKAADVQFTKGVQHMDGKTALFYVRQRYQFADGDFARNRHQRALLAAIAEKIISANTLSDPARLTSLVRTAAPFLTIDSGLTPQEIISLGLQMRNIRSSDIHYYQFPHGGPAMIKGASVVKTDEPAMERLREALKTDDMSTYYSREAKQ